MPPQLTVHLLPLCRQVFGRSMYINLGAAGIPWRLRQTHNMLGHTNHPMAFKDTLNRVQKRVYGRCCGDCMPLVIHKFLREAMASMVVVGEQVTRKKWVMLVGEIGFLSRLRFPIGLAGIVLSYI